MQSLTFQMCQEVEQSLQRSYEDWGNWGRREGQNLEVRAYRERVALVSTSSFLLGFLKGYTLGARMNLK